MLSIVKTNSEKTLLVNSITVSLGLTKEQGNELVNVLLETTPQHLEATHSTTQQRESQPCRTATKFDDVDYYIPRLIHSVR